MAKPNYAYEKRQRELEKKQKKEDKALKRKADIGHAGPHDAGESVEPQTPASVAGDKSAA